MSSPLVIPPIAMPLALQVLQQEQKAVLMEQKEDGFDLSQVDEDGTKSLRFVVRGGLPAGVEKGRC